MSLMVELRTRDFTAPLITPRLELIPRRYSSQAVGGPEYAELSALGAEMELRQLKEWLRCPLVISTVDHEPCWWGYIESVEAQYGAVWRGWSLRPMANRVAVSYQVAQGGTASGLEAMTGWAEEPDSVATYGVKELVVSLSLATGEQAERVRDRVLAQRGWPIKTMRVADGQSLGARIVARGWYDTLDWRYCYQPAGTVEVTQQVVNMVAAGGQFITETLVEATPGLASSAKRNGEATVRAEVGELLTSGPDGSRRYLARVSPQRQLVVSDEPQPGIEDCLIGADGQIRNGWGAPVGRAGFRAGVWLGEQDAPQEAAMFVERCEYSVASQLLALEPPGLPSPWEIGRVVQG